MSGPESLVPNLYEMRYAETLQARNSALRALNDGELPLARTTFNHLLGLQDNGINIADPVFIRQHKGLVTASLPIFRASLQQAYVVELFDTLLDRVDPTKRIQESIPLADTVTFIEDKNNRPDENNVQILNMYAYLLGVAPEQIMQNFNTVSSLNIFLSSIKDKTQLYPFPPKKTIQLLAPIRQVPNIGEVVHLPTRLPGIRVEYAYQKQNETPETSLLIGLL